MGLIRVGFNFKLLGFVAVDAGEAAVVGAAQRVMVRTAGLLFAAGRAYLFEGILPGPVVVSHHRALDTHMVISFRRFCFRDIDGAFFCEFCG